MSNQNTQLTESEFLQKEILVQAANAGSVIAPVVQAKALARIADAMGKTPEKPTKRQERHELAKQVLLVLLTHPNVRILEAPGLALQVAKDFQKTSEMDY